MRVHGIILFRCASDHMISLSKTSLRKKISIFLWKVPKCLQISKYLTDRIKPARDLTLRISSAQVRWGGLDSGKISRSHG